MIYYELIPDDSRDDLYTIDNCNMEGCDIAKLYSKKGVITAEDLTGLTISMETENKIFTDNVTGQVPFYVWSKRLLSFIEQELKIGTLQSYPVKVIDLTSGRIRDDYYLVNPTYIIDCIDFDYSTIIRK